MSYSARMTGESRRTHMPDTASQLAFQILGPFSAASDPNNRGDGNAPSILEHARDGSRDLNNVPGMLCWTPQYTSSMGPGRPGPQDACRLLTFAASARHWANIGADDTLASASGCCDAARSRSPPPDHTKCLAHTRHRSDSTWSPTCGLVAYLRGHQRDPATPRSDSSPAK